MNIKNLLGIIMAVLVFGLVVLATETTMTGWQIALGFIVFWSLALGFTNFRNTFLLLTMTLGLLISIYVSFKYSWLGVVPGAIAGIAVGLMMHFGWIVPHKPFSRTEYIKTQK